MRPQQPIKVLENWLCYEWCGGQKFVEIKNSSQQEEFQTANVQVSKGI